MKWIKSQNKRNPIRRENHGALKKPMQVVVWRWEAKGMSQRALASSVLLPSWTWACRVHKALISCWQPEITALVAELRKHALEGLQDREEEKTNSEPHGVPFYSHFSDSSHKALPANIEQVGFWLREDDALFRYTQTWCKREQRAWTRMAHHHLSSFSYTYYYSCSNGSNKQQQNGANNKRSCCPMFSKSGAETPEVPWDK